jgi:hypothetical protein
MEKEATHEMRVREKKKKKRFGKRNEGYLAVEVLF